MSPKPIDLNIMAGDEVRLQPPFLEGGSNQREVFRVDTAPRPGTKGVLKLVSLLNKREVYVAADEDCIKEKVV